MVSPSAAGQDAGERTAAPGIRGALLRARPGSLGLITLLRTATVTGIAITLQWPRDLCA